MATSGSFRTTSYEGRSLTFSWNRTSSNIANNTSTIAWSVTGSGDSGYVTCGDIDIVINGTTVYNSAPSDRVDVWLGGVVASGTTTISHNADGSKSFSASINAAIYNYAQNCSGSGTWALDTIPRASNIDKVANTSGTTISTLNTGNDVRVYFTPKSTAFKYRVTVSMNGNSVQNNASGVSVSSTSQQYYQVNIPHTWLSNKESGTLACKLETLNGTSVIGTDNWSISMVVPASVVPTIGAVSSAPVNSNATINGWNIYVANYSKARITCSASGNSGSTISRFQISGDTTVTVNGTSLSYDINLTSSGTKTFTVKAIDSRGRSTGNKSITINVTSYSTPTIQSFNVVRCDSNGNINAEGTSAKLSFVGYYSAIGNNTATVNFAYKLASASTFSSLTNSATGSGGSVNGNIISSTFAIANDYDLKIILKDSLGNAVERTVRLASVTRTLNVAKYGNGVAVGKMSTVSTNGAAGKFECGWDASFDKSVSIDGILNANKNIYMGGLKGQTSGLSIVFSNPDSSENPHNSYIYGGNPAAQTAIGCWDNKNGRNIWSYNDSSNTFAIGSSDATISIKGAALSDFVVQQGTSGNWYYRKWNSGRAECWGNIPINTAITGSIGSIYYAAIENIAFPSGLFINKPLVFANSTSTAVLTVAIRGSTTTKSVFGINLMYPMSYPNAITWEVAVEARGTWK
jgi:hypothetical protein